MRYILFVYFILPNGWIERVPVPQIAADDWRQCEINSARVNPPTPGFMRCEQVSR